MGFQTVSTWMSSACPAAWTIMAISCHAAIKSALTVGLDELPGAQGMKLPLNSYPMRSSIFSVPLGGPDFDDPGIIRIVVASDDLPIEWFCCKVQLPVQIATTKSHEVKD
jgi:hypothetical protein